MESPVWEIKKGTNIKAGYTYGVVEVLEESKERLPCNVKTWICKCGKCGKIFKCTGATVYEYHSTGCADCRKKERKERHLLELGAIHTGEVYGSLRILGVDCFDKQGKPVATTECLQCGRITSTRLNPLKIGQIKQCKYCGAKNLKTGQELVDIAHVDGTLVMAIDGRRKTNKNSTTGINGVSQMKSGRYRAYINFKRKCYHLGVFKTLEEALATRKKAEKEMFGSFLEWYKSEYPDRWKALQENLSEK